MTRLLKRMLVVALMAIPFSACSSPGGDTGALPKGAATGPAGLPSLVDCLDKFDLVGLNSLHQISEQADAKLDGFLGCYVGPHGIEPDKVSRKTGLLRAHILTAMVSRYAVFNVTGEVGTAFNMEFRRVPDMSQVASNIILDFGRIERGIRIDSELFQDAQRESQPYDELPTVARTYRTIERLERVLDMVDSIRESSRPTRVRARQGIENLFAAVSVPAPANIKTALNDARTALQKLLILDQFGYAYRIDIANYLQCTHVRETTGSRPTGDKAICKASMKEDWQFWDKMLGEACGRLAKVADIGLHGCMPFAYKT